LIRKANGGLAGARKEGISRADGDYLYFLDAGDRPVTLLHEYLSSVVESGCDVAVCSWSKVTKGGDVEQHQLTNVIDDPVRIW
jgi:glycosyltransferase involved in cell wall biosynthesis